MALALLVPSNVMTHMGQISSQSGITAFNQHFHKSKKSGKEEVHAQKAQSYCHGHYPFGCYVVTNCNANSL
jgi:hypothetical protein